MKWDRLSASKSFLRARLAPRPTMRSVISVLHDDNDVDDDDCSPFFLPPSGHQVTGPNRCRTIPWSGCMPAARITGGLHRATEDCVRRAHLQATTNYSTRPGQAPENRSYLARMSHSGGGSKRHALRRESDSAASRRGAARSLCAVGRTYRQKQTIAHDQVKLLRTAAI